MTKTTTTPAAPVEFEAEFIDAKTNQTVAKVVRKVFGTQLSNESEKISTKDFKAAIDKLNADLAAFIR